MEKKQGIGVFEKYLSLWVVWALRLTPKNVYDACHIDETTSSLYQLQKRYYI